MDDLKRLPKAVHQEIGYALHDIQKGNKPPNVKSLKGLGPGIMEIVSDFDKNTYRVVYALKLGKTIYVLHVFQKKSKKGIKTPKLEMAQIKQRLSWVKRKLM